MCDDRSRADICALPYLHGSDQSRVAAHKSSSPDVRRMLTEPVIIAGNGTGTYIHVRAHSRIAEIGEMHCFSAGIEVRLFQLDEVTDLRTFRQMVLKA